MQGDSISSFSAFHTASLIVCPLLMLGSRNVFAKLESKLVKLRHRNPEVYCLVGLALKTHFYELLEYS